MLESRAERASGAARGAEIYVGINTRNPVWIIRFTQKDLLILKTARSRLHQIEIASKNHLGKSCKILSNIAERFVDFLGIFTEIRRLELSTNLLLPMSRNVAEKL